MKISKKEKECKRERGLTILLSLIFGLFGFFGGYAANYIWWREKNERNLILSGNISLITFFGIAIFFYFLVRKWKNNLG